MKPSLSPDGLAAFLVEAKRHTYAAQGDDASVPPLLPNSKQLEYRHGDWLYRDIYFGFMYFIGQETVYQLDTPSWSMGYAGEVIDPHASREEAGHIYGFLQAALQQVQLDRPYRGPTVFQEDSFTYTDKSQGDLNSFWGSEEITRAGVMVYRLRYHGGMVR